MKNIFHVVAAGVFHLGGFGMIILGIVDSSFLTVPVANDLLVIAQSATHHSRFLYYAVMAAAGSTLGCVVVDVVTRKAEGRIEKKVSNEKLQFVERHVRKHAGWATAVAAILPPPFPFTPFVIAAAGTGYPRKKLFGIIGTVRFIRFAVEGLLAIRFGQGILALANSPKVEYSIVALIIIAIIGSGISIYGWIKKARKSPSEQTPQKHQEDSYRAAS
jgi:membrane protein YqaA with SNARE-associated domain